MAWPMTLTPTYEAVKRETSGKPSIREKPAQFLGTGHQCKNDLLPSIKPNVCESVEMSIRIVRLYLRYCILPLSILFYFGICDSIIYIMSVIFIVMA
jgi:hypothetical protein